ncbi:DUF1045 domain-containing protein [Oryzifoliimicrobium ureilyticus]|uniref:DUF1045 domain-containing protein n=1 Tax=Oryzifoliimicrobium ureilyticus TaxID=3113724 RepID=UPI00307665F7
MRYALYFTPPQDHPLTVAAARWLGRDAFTGDEFPRRDYQGLEANQQSALTADPRRYGFHATLKAPFHLVSTESEAQLLASVDAFATKTAPFSIPQLVLGQLGRFFALVPASHYEPLQSFAAAAVRDFEPLRAPLSESDIARRKPEKLSERQRENLMTWGYPYVMEEFRFHMTLTNEVPDEQSAVMRTVLEDLFDGFIGRPLDISGIAVFREESRGTPFKVHQWLPLRGA